MIITKEAMLQDFERFLGVIFALPETVSVQSQGITLERELRPQALREQARAIVQRSYHDLLSDLDLKVTVRLSPGDPAGPDGYMGLTARYGLTDDACLGIARIPENRTLRVVKRNGMRYDLGFEFVLDPAAGFVAAQAAGRAPTPDEAAADRFWFVQIQALGKLYRGDYLISDHLAHVNLNETLVLQMRQRDARYGANHHRYGHREALDYLSHLEKACPYRGEDAAFSRIAHKLYAAALSYDALAGKVHAAYQARGDLFLSIWADYEQGLTQTAAP